MRDSRPVHDVVALLGAFVAGLQHRLSYFTYPAPEEINETSFREYSQYGAPGMLHNIGLQLRASPQLYEQFRHSQRKESGNDSTLHWVFNNATRWDSDMRMMERALLLRPALNTFFNDVQNRWETESGYENTKPRVLQYRLSAYDWKVIEILVKLLKPFEIATKQLQGNGIPGSRSTCGSFDEYFPVFEILLDHLESAIDGTILEVSRCKSLTGSSLVAPNNTFPCRGARD